MATYDISRRQLVNARKLGVIIAPSTLKNKKIDVYNLDGLRIASIGAKGYKDYSIYLSKGNITHANKRRKLYLNRHKGDSKGIPGAYTNSYYADKILWN
jgi:hypothetical protein